MALWTDKQSVPCIMLCYKVILVLVLAAAFSWSLDDRNSIEVDTPLGGIRGNILLSRKGQNFYAFRGMRYAKPPVGERRFQAPVPVDPWDGILDATKDGYFCPQNHPLIDNSLTSEDCLILNVYTKDLKGTSPVLVFIPGGAFKSGGSHSIRMWGPQYLMDKDIVFVTINYRLGPLGFLSTGTEDAPGNFGFKDQVEALRWIRKNIRAFGGDSNIVTLWGHSAGAIGATAHLVSPMSKGLFHRVIAMSGSCATHIKPMNQISTKRLAHKLGCSTSSPKLLIKCLRQVPYNEIIDGTTLFETVLPWFYEIEKNYGQERFLEEDPSILFAQGKFEKVPILTGITKDELMPTAYQIYNNSELLNEFNNNFEIMAPVNFFYNPNRTHVTKILRSAYLKNKEITWDNLERFGDIFSDATVMHAVHRFANLVKRHTDIYYYRYDFQGRYSWVYGTDGKPFGIFHSDDLLYLLVHLRKAPMFKITDPENVMVEKSTELWTTFARTGNPTNSSSEWIGDIKWEPFKFSPLESNNLKVLYINEKSFLAKEPNQARTRLWDILFPITTKI